MLKTVIPSEASANLSLRLVPDQAPDSIAANLEALVRQVAPRGAALDIEILGLVPPSRINAEGRPIKLALDAVEAVTGMRPLFTRWGASLPVISALTQRGIPTVLTGFAPADGHMHAPNEWMPLRSLQDAIRAAVAIFAAWGHGLV